MDDLQFARYMDKQHPDRWEAGQWYPAKTPDGTPVEVCRTKGRGRSSGVPFLHIRHEVPMVIVEPDGTRVPLKSTGYIWIRANLRTGETKRVD